MITKWKILYLNSCADISGAERSLYYLIKNLDPDLFEPLVVLGGEGKFADLLRDAKIPLVITRLSKLNKRNPLSTFAYIKSVFDLVKIIRKHEVDILHINGNYDGRFALAGKLGKVKCVMHLRNIVTKKIFYFDFLFLADCFISISEYVYRSAQKFRKISGNNRIIYNGVDLAETKFSTMQRNDFRRRMGILDSGLLIGIAGQIAPVKGHLNLLQVIKRLKNKFPEFTLLIAGDTRISGNKAYEKEVFDFINANDLGTHVQYIGFIDNINEFYCGIDILVVPSLYEPFGRVIVEAMACEKVVVASNVGGGAEIIEDGVDGYLFNPHDKEEMLSALSRAIRNRDNLQMGLRARQKIENKFSIINSADKIMKFHKTIA